MHVYALIKATSTIALPTGTIGTLHLVQHGEVSAIVEPALELAALQQDEQALLSAIVSHDRVIREIFRQATVLPLRFTSFVTLPDLQADLRAHQTRYLTQLDYLADKVEHTLKLSPAPFAEDLPISADVKGKDYFLAKKLYLQTLHRQQMQQSEELQHLLDAIVHHYPTHQPCLQQPRQDVDPVRIVHLLVTKTNTLVESVQQWQMECLQWHLSLSEALPPYHFTEV
jgi:Gas vesicle synthesis protein GvpL/GvpF